MKKIAAAVMALMAVSANAECEFDGKKYKPFDSVSVLSSEYTPELEAQGYAKDGYAMAFVCMPSVDMQAVNIGDWQIGEIPVNGSFSWVPSEMLYAFNRPKLVKK